MAKNVALWFKNLDAESERTRRAAEHRFMTTTPDDGALVPAFFEHLSHRRARHRYWAARALSNLNELAAPALPSLEKLVDDRNRDCRFWALVALSNMRKHALSALPTVLARLEDSAFGVRQMAATALINISPKARATERAIIKRMAVEPNRFAREEFVRALGKIGSKNAVTALAGALRDRDVGVRRHAAIHLKCLGTGAVSALQALEKLLETERNAGVRLQAETALRLCKPTKKKPHAVR